MISLFNKGFNVTSRNRMLSAIEFRNPDMIPVVYHPSPAGLYTHGKKLLSLFQYYPPDNPISFDVITTPTGATFDNYGNYNEIRKDEWGVEWEYRIFGIQGHPVKYPFHGWELAKSYKFPALPSIDSEKIAKQREGYLVCSEVISIWERLYAIQPMEQILMDTLTEDPGLLSFLDRLVEYWLSAIYNMLDAGIDVVMFGDDWGTQQAPLISPKLL